MNVLIGPAYMFIKKLSLVCNQQCVCYQERLLWNVGEVIIQFLADLSYFLASEGSNISLKPLNNWQRVCHFWLRQSRHILCLLINTLELFVSFNTLRTIDWRIALLRNTGKSFRERSNLMQQFHEGTTIIIASSLLYPHNYWQRGGTLRI